MADLSNLTNITPPRVPLLDARSGQISREWYLFLFSQFTQSKTLTIDNTLNQEALAILTAENDANQVAIADLTVSLQNTQNELDATQTELGLSQQAAFDPTNLQNSIQALDVSQQTPFDPTNLQNSIQALELGPADTPQLPRKRYGSFYDTTTQLAALINTAYAITFNSTDMSVGVTLGSPTSRVYVDTHNVYNIQFSAQIDKTSGGTANVWIWLRKNGVDVPYSAGQIQIQGNNAETVPAWNYLLDMNAGDYFELMWEVSDVSVELTSFVASAIHPGTPSVILTVSDNISV